MQKIRSLFIGLLVVSSLSQAFAQLQAPDAFFPHKRGEHYTPHYMLADYVRHIAANSQYTKLYTYGYTNERRPLMLLVISSPENIQQLDAIRLNNLYRTGLAKGTPNSSLDRAFVWLGYSVHGDEASGSEAVPQVIYDLVDPANASTKEWLKNTIVLIDPSVNPDGYDRFTHWARQVGQLNPVSETHAREQNQPWPGGRVNHYLFDLNRDWAWQTQVESQQRSTIYHQWMPHVVADLHEMGPNESYYFAPAAKPYHKYITNWQTDFQKTIGSNHARYFDQNGWLYFTREVFDLFYPSYGDSYPTFSGAIGMTYEQAAGDGRAYKMKHGDELTLKDRVDHHYTTSMSTIEVSSKNASTITKEFGAYFDKAQNNPPGVYKTFVVKKENGTAKLKALCDLLDRNHIAYGKAGRNANTRGYDYQQLEEKAVTVAEGDLIISAYQPKGVLAQILFEPEPELEDSLTYDITAWALPYAHGLQAFALKEKWNVQESFSFTPFNNTPVEEAPYGLIAPWSSATDATLLAYAFQNGIHARLATAPFSMNGVSYARGTLVFTRGDNRKTEGWHKKILDKANALHIPLTVASTGLVSSGSDFAGSDMRLITAPKVAVIMGEGVVANSYGQLWHHFEHNLQYPFTAIHKDQVTESVLRQYQVVVLTDGSSYVSVLEDWVSGGGKLICIGSSIRRLPKSLGLSSAAEEEDEEKSADIPFADRTRHSISSEIPGAIFPLTMDITHPLAFGLPTPYYTLKTGTEVWKKENVTSVGYIVKDQIKHLGFVGSAIKDSLKNTLVVGTKESGRGSVVYLADNPLYRGFWQQGHLLFANALFF